MNYSTLNDFVLIKQIAQTGLVVAGKDEDPNATLHGIVTKDEVDPQSLDGKEVVFVRGQARKITLDAQDYFIIKRDKLLLCQN